MCVVCLCLLLCCCAVVISFNTLGLGVNDDASREASMAATTANQLLESLTRAALNAFSSGLETISMPLLSFISAYVARLRALVKRGEQLPASVQMHVQVGGLFDRGSNICTPNRGCMCRRMCGWVWEHAHACAGGVAGRTGKGP